MELFIDNRQNKIEIKEELNEIIKKVAKECLEFENRTVDYEISVSIVENEEIKQLNNTYRGVDKVTDVLSFPMEEEDSFIEDGELEVLGDIVISAERALEQSNDFGHDFIREIAYLTAHSMFHLMGYDHMTEEDKNDMRDREKQVMKNLGIFK